MNLSTSALSATSPGPIGTRSLPAVDAKQLSQQFLQLLVAQLKNQDPLKPQDGSAFVAQLAQMSSVSELVNIHSVLDDIGTKMDTLAAVGGTMSQGPDGSNPSTGGGASPVTEETHA